MVGTVFPGSSRFTLCAISPLTGIWGESSSGGSFGVEFKRTGVDGAVFLGKAQRPSYVLIEDDAVSLLDAGDVWGMDTYETIDTLRARHGGKRGVKVLAIGPAGERQVKFASVCNDKANYFGRTGMGAVMGAKNIKAIVVRGSGKVPIACEDRFRSVRAEAVKIVKESLLCESSRAAGTAAAMELGALLGDVPFKNWAEGGHEEMGETLGGTTMASEIVTGRKACLACPIGCKPVVKVDHPTYGFPEGPGPEYETLAAFGTLIMNGDLPAVAYANDLCNRLGLDTITCGSTIALIMEAYEKGYVSLDDVDGLDMA
ncbi:MAG: hypothetical protein MI741_02910, partial [Rhodospirillales bacterium]|nr:hypothetical protein [Rhodospirillales bacterium]